ncbi:pentapeptide repeat-containing protein [Rhizobium sp. L43]|uniref:pentapeptide repeat-containing protein n=1 Tax=Rhizobium sp. L43 TaxID=2035452 RepID=UPI000BE8EF27|nr:pentapeptide repeat-containing protein [Rhizobium sp. L43]PDS78724.1 hypothetical protein CO667_10755 [Rhizobium sp. L43]
MMSLEEACQRTTVVTDMSFKNDDMSEYRLREVQFHRCRFTDCNFDLAQIHDSRFIGCHFTDCSFREAVFAKCSFYDPEGGSATHWNRCDLSYAKFDTSDLAHSTFSKGSAYRLALTDCNAVQMKFGCAVHRQTARRVIKGGVVFINCKMHLTMFAKGDYEESQFETCDMRECDLSGSQLNYVSFRGSNLVNADLTGSSLDGVTLAYASIEGFDISSIRSFDSMVVSRDQHELLLGSLGIRTLD